MSDQTELRLLKLATAASFFFALVNHLLPPKAYPVTQLLFDYEFGLIRRGLVGEVLNLFLTPPVSIAAIYAAAAVLSGAAAFAFMLFLDRRMEDEKPTFLLLILALNSYAFASFVGNTGYLDTVLLMLVLLALSASAQSGIGLIFRLSICIIGILVHEIMLPFFTVLIAFDLWLARGPTKPALLVAISPVAIGFAVVAGFAVFLEVPPELANRIVAAIDQKAAFNIDPESTAVIGRTVADNLVLMTEMRATSRYWAWVLFDGVPLFAMSLWLIWLNLKILGKPAPAVSKLLVAGAILAPLSMNFIAFDVVRFGAVSVLSGFITVTLISRYVVGAFLRLGQVLSYPHFIVILVLNANIFTIQVNQGGGHVSQFPWVLLSQIEWFAH